MDLGTATKISVLDEQGTYLGCTISAGVGISLDALPTASQLPHISIEAPHHVVGELTSLHAVRHSVPAPPPSTGGLCDRIEEELGRPVKTVVATGGTKSFLVAESQHTEKICFWKGLS